MNLLKQTALILGLASLSIGVWTLYKNWRQKIAILFATLCFFIAIWALSFVSHATLQGRLSTDIHFFFNIWLAPIGVTVLSQVLAMEDRVSRTLKWLSLIGAIILSVMVAFTITDAPWVMMLVTFWPSFVLAEYLYLMIQDFILKKPVNVDFIPIDKRRVLYFGLGVSLLTCSMDHIPSFGYTIPAIGNLLFTTYLLFLAQLITPQKILRIEALVTRFFATVILALVITGFFALLYQYISESFPLFLLNSFLISFAILVLWSPLVSFFRYLGSRLFKAHEMSLNQRIDQFLMSLSTVTDVHALEKLLQESFAQWIDGTSTRMITQLNSHALPKAVTSFIQLAREQKAPPVLHRELVKMERDQVLTVERREELNLLLHYLDAMKADVVFPIFHQEQHVALVMITTPTLLEEWSGSFGLYAKIYEALQPLGPLLIRLSQIEEEREKDRLVLLGEMAAGLAHEVRNPLGAIRGAAELLDPENAWAKVIQEEVNRLNRLVSQFLDFAHAPKEKPEVINLVDVMEATILNLRSVMPKNDRFDFVVSAPVIRVKAVPDHLQQVLINLIQNGFKAVEEKGSGHVEVQAFEFGFRVIDTGIGMDEETLSKVFQPFYTSFKKGTGLGLAICQRLVHFGHGRIQIESEKGKGTVVTVSLATDSAMDSGMDAHEG